MNRAPIHKQHSMINFFHGIPHNIFRHSTIYCALHTHVRYYQVKRFSCWIPVPRESIGCGCIKYQRVISKLAGSQCFCTMFNILESVTVCLVSFNSCRTQLLLWLKLRKEKHPWSMMERLHNALVMTFQVCNE